MNVVAIIILTSTYWQLLKENKDSWIKIFPEWMRDLFLKVYDYTGYGDLFPIEQVSIFTQNLILTAQIVPRTCKGIWRVS
jgi:hypothetical protein